MSKLEIQKERPKVGVGVIVHDSKGNIIMGERAGSHGAGMFWSLNFEPGTTNATWQLTIDRILGTMQCPSGYLEYGKSFEDCAKREAFEEMGLEVGNIKFLTATNDVMEEGKHYVTIYVTCVITGENKVPQVSQSSYHCCCWIDIIIDIIIESLKGIYGYRLMCTS